MCVLYHTLMESQALTTSEKTGEPGLGGLQEDARQAAEVVSAGPDHLRRVRLRLQDRERQREVGKDVLDLAGATPVGGCRGRGPGLGLAPPGGAPVAGR